MINSLSPADASAYKLGRKFGVLLKQCGEVTVAEAQKTRPDIEIDTDPKFTERAIERPTWWVYWTGERSASDAVRGAR